MLIRIHFIAIGGAIMHQLAIELQRNGHQVTGSDDEIFEPARSNLLKYRLLPEAEGWFPEKLNLSIDAVILGMHARADNPELLRAKELGLRIFSFPEWIYEYSKHKKRIVVAGSHGKTSTTAMIMHVLKNTGRDFDFLVGAKIDGFEQSVHLSDAPIIIIEGDEYPASAEEKIPKIHFYRPDISVLTGIEWDHINVFPTLENYVSQFDIYLQKMQTDHSLLIYCMEDETVFQLVQKQGEALNSIPYKTPNYEPSADGVLLVEDGIKYPLSIFGKHNLQNITAARKVCAELGIDTATFFDAIKDFSGAAKRLEKVKEDEAQVVFKDFAHAPSKVKATMKAVREQYPHHQLIACLELHTYSSLNESFLVAYQGSLKEADAACVFFSEHALALKQLPMLDAEKIKSAFGQEDIEVCSQQQALLNWIAQQKKQDQRPVCLLMMSSGTFNQLDWSLL